MYCDRRIGGIEKWYLEKPKDADMIVPREILNCVCFIGLQTQDGSYHPKGTAFFLGQLREGTAGPPLVYVVTAKHLITKIKDLGCDRVCLRLNCSSGGFSWHDTPLQDWVSHPTDPSVDVAVLAYQNTPSPLSSGRTESDHMVYPLQSLVDQSKMLLGDIGIG